ncbi:MAG: hypothetical protein DDG58_07485 [Ardenticatenia bacterium]|nr:MAG: hypothetical protein DDG58_07485 [Ardenticatenia bacterium]
MTGLHQEVKIAIPPFPGKEQLQPQLTQAMGHLECIDMAILSPGAERTARVALDEHLGLLSQARCWGEGSGGRWRWSYHLIRTVRYIVFDVPVVGQARLNLDAIFAAQDALGWPLDSKDRGVAIDSIFQYTAIPCVALVVGKGHVAVVGAPRLNPLVVGAFADVVLPHILVAGVRTLLDGDTVPILKQLDVTVGRLAVDTLVVLGDALQVD